MATRSASARSPSGSSTCPDLGRTLAMAQSRAMARDPRIERGLLAQLTGRHRRLEDGESSLGWKLGMGEPAAMERRGTSAPLVGYRLRSGLVESGGMVEVGAWSNARLEPEIAVHIGADLGRDATRDD